MACLWRLVEAGRIRFTSEDDGQQFGLPAPVDAASEVNGRLVGAAVEAVQLRKGLLDLELDSARDTRFKLSPIHPGMRLGKFPEGTGSSLQVVAANWQSLARTWAAANVTLAAGGGGPADRRH